MFKTNKRLVIAFAITCMMLLICNVWLLHLHLVYFAPFIALTYYEKSKISALWYSVLCGFIMDCLSSQAHFGLFTLNYCLTTMLLYELKPLFFADRLTTIPVISSCFAATTTILQFILIDIFGGAFNFTLQWLIIDVLLMSIVDGIYGLICFALPLTYIKSEKVVRSQYILNKRTRPTVHQRNTFH